MLCLCTSIYASLPAAFTSNVYADDWEEPEYLAFEGLNEKAKLALDASGNSLLLWTQEIDKAAGHLCTWAAWKPVGERRWNTAVKVLELPGDDAYCEAGLHLLDFDAMGNAWAVWSCVKGKGASGTLFASKFSCEKASWSEVRRIEGFWPEHLHLGAARDGRALVAFTSLGAPDSAPMPQAGACVSGLNNSDISLFGPPLPKDISLCCVVLEDGPRECKPILLGKADFKSAMMMAMSPDGSAMLAYGSLLAVKTREWSPEMGLGKEYTLSSSLGDCNLRLLNDGEGRFTMLSTRALGNCNRIQRSLFSGQKGWVEAADSLQFSLGGSYSACMDWEGRIRLVWRTYNTGTNKYGSSALHFIPQTGWGTVESFSGGNLLGHLVMGGSGVAMMTESQWAQENAFRPVQFFRVATPSGAWADAERIPYLGPGASLFSLTMNYSGMASVLIREITMVGDDNETVRWGTMSFLRDHPMDRNGDGPGSPASPDFLAGVKGGRSPRFLDNTDDSKLSQRGQAVPPELR